MGGAVGEQVDRQHRENDGEDRSPGPERNIHIKVPPPCPHDGEQLEVSPTIPGAWGGRRSGPNRVGRTDGDIVSGVLPSWGTVFTKYDSYVKPAADGSAR
ncbi:hypothetical protein GCM10009841_15130 [Microlunatus panaciterrae]